MRYYEVPVISGSTEEQIEQIKQYLYRQRDDLNYNLENTTPERFWQKTADALSIASGSSSEAKNEEELRRDEYNSLRALVLKSATAVIKVEDSFSHSLQGAYLAESDFGSFMEQGFVNIKGSPYTIAQLYRYQSTVLNGVNEYKTNLEGYIETGVLDRDTSSPVFGMDIGYNRNTFTFNDKEYTNAEPSKIRITPKKISFMEGRHEVAYIEKKAVYFPVAHITGGSLDINKNFTVDSFGNMKAKNADVEGTIRASKGYIGGFEITGSTAGKFWPCSIASVINPSDETSYQYAMFLRGNYTESGDEYGALDTTHNLIGIKKRRKSSATWDNDTSPYTFRVSVKGNVYCNELVAEDRINGKYIKAHSERVALGQTDDTVYSGNIELLTNGGQVYIGNNSIKPYDITMTAKYVRSNADLVPYSHATYNFGHIERVWLKGYIRHITADADIYIGKSGDDFSNDIFVETGGNLYLGHDAVPNYNAYLVASNGIRIGQNNDNLKTTTVNIRGGTITISGDNINLNGTVKVNGATI